MSFIERDPQDERSQMCRLMVVKDKAFARILLFNKKDGTMDFFLSGFPRALGEVYILADFDHFRSLDFRFWLFLLE